MTDDISAHLLSDIHNLCTSLISNPLYLSYLLFFSPTLLKLLFFLSPLFLTTSLLLLPLLLTLSPPLHHNAGHEEALQAYSIVFDVADDQAREHHHCHHQPSEAEEDPTTFADVVEVVMALDEELEGDVFKGRKVVYSSKEVLQAYNIVFDVSDQAREHQEQQQPSEAEEESTQFADVWITKPVEVIMALHQKEVEEEEKEQVVKGQKADYLSKAVEQQKVHEEESKANSERDEAKEANFSQMGSYGSMRKEKEWRRTLACKLFEERRGNDSAEGMDLLWEAYDDSSNQVKKKEKEKKNKALVMMKSSVKSLKKGGGGSSNRIGHHCCDEEEEEEEISWDDDDDDDDDEGSGGKLCCLQALKLSAGKMNLGIGRPSLVKFRKAVKGFGWLHNRHSKKRPSLN